MMSPFTNGLACLCAVALWAPALTQAAEKQPNILVIWGDDISIHNFGAYNLGVMGDKMPNIHHLAKEGALFTDFYAQQSCTRAAPLILGRQPFRTRLLTIGMPSSLQGIPDGCSMWCSCWCSPRPH